MSLRVGRSANNLRMLMDEAPAWAKFVGIELTDARHESDGRLLLTFGPTTQQEERFKTRGSQQPNGEHLFQWAGSNVLKHVPETFGMTEANMVAQTENSFVVEVPAERTPVRAATPPPRKAAKPAPTPTSLATIKETVKAMAKESPPPNFTPAIPLREAVDTINAYVLHEGEAIELTVSKRGRLKVRYEYGG